MAEKTLNIFLSASVPVIGRAEGKYLKTADVIAIRDAVIALVSVALPKYHLIWGGHPSITPLITNVLRHSNKDVNNSVTEYQSMNYVKVFPKENKYVAHKVYTDNMDDEEKSLAVMRRQMIDDNEYAAAFFIGGMDGVEDEYERFVKSHPQAKVFPVASTGATALMLYEKDPAAYNPRLKTDMAYASLFKDLLGV